MNVTTLRNHDLSTEEMNNLIQYVKHNGEDVTRKTFIEILGESFASFKLASEGNKIGNFIWNDHNMTSCYSGSSLRDIFRFLMTLGSICRRESLYKADLVIFVILLLHNEEKDIHITL